MGVLFTIHVLLCSFNEIFLINNGEREFASNDFSKLSVSQRFFSFVTISNCPLSVLRRCPFHREFQYRESYKNRSGPRGVRLTEVSVKRKLTVYMNQRETNISIELLRLTSLYSCSAALYFPCLR